MMAMTLGGDVTIDMVPGKHGEVAFATVSVVGRCVQLPRAIGRGKTLCKTAA